MMNWSRYYSTSLKKGFYPNSTVKVYRKAKAPLKPTGPATLKSISRHEPKCNKPKEKGKGGTESCSVTPSAGKEYFENIVKVQMISRNLHKQIFGNTSRTEYPVSSTSQSYITELCRHGIDVERTEIIQDVQLKLPQLQGKNIEEHFYAIAKDQVAPYEQLLLPLVQCAALPARPKKWEFCEGWTSYDELTGKVQSVEFPSEDALVFDVEVCVLEGAAPIMATAVGLQHWYSWVSPRLIHDNSIEQKHRENAMPHYTPDDLIPLGRYGPKVIVGHNVSYDRARLREQYLVEDTGTRFVDTMSLHMCVSGITSYQRALLKSQKELSPEDHEWQAQSALNSLIEVHRLYCGGEPLSKEPRDVFLTGTLSDVREKFQSLMSYCAGDVEATHNILRNLYPLYAERFPHPATLAGVLEMGSAYLPVNSNWLRYINESNLAYEDLNIEAKNHLSRRADEACALLKDDKYRQHVWLWDEDWSVQQLKLKQPKRLSKKNEAQVSKFTKSENKENAPDEECHLQSKFQYLHDMKSLLPARRPLLPGYPAWYRKLCQKPHESGDKGEVWIPGATEISTGMQIAPKLLSLCWEGYPLHYLKEHGWGFLVPFRTQHYPPVSSETEVASPYRIPIEQLVVLCPIPDFCTKEASETESEYAFSALNSELESKLGKREYYSKPRKDHTNGIYKGTGVWCNQVLEGCCYFFKLPHKNGNSFRVGNPLSKDFLNKFSENVLSSGESMGGSAARVIEIARMMSYWRNNRDRIMGQMVIWLTPNYLPDHLQSLKSTVGAMQFGAICPQVVACGTLTRRAMEPTWMTASNSQRERIGSELRAMVQAPPTYRIVGADVDSQELWIASVLGDAYAHGIHGATPLGWMTLSGSKLNGTDMHSVTAKAVGISRDHAKVINYARIYGAGQNFAEGLLKQFNPNLSSAEAKSKAMKMFAITKGRRIYRLREEFLEEHEDRNYSGYEALKLASSCNRAVSEMFHKSQWQGGTESAMFNRLEEIATGEHPVTPFLSGRLSRALEVNSNDENRFLPTRINWVVQSGAVDFLHLMLVCMRWLMGPNVRFCLSFHDEVRYLVKEDLAYKAALALHVTNLLTRAFCSSRIGLKDLPMSVAFFSSVEVDTVLRKESTMDCKTPSNPHGLKIGYGIPAGESLNIYEAIDKAGGCDLNEWKWVK